MTAERSTRGVWHPIATAVGEVAHSSPGDRHLDVCLTGRAKDFGCLVFRNNYAASVSVEQLLKSRPETGVEGEASLAPSSRQRRRGSSSGADTVVLLPRLALMRHAHFEDDAQAWHVIYAQQFEQPLVDEEPFDTPSIILRLRLNQPSPNWRVVGVSRVQAYAWVEHRPITADLVPSSVSSPLDDACEKLARLRGMSRRAELHRLEATVCS